MTLQIETFASAKLSLSTTPESTDLYRWRLHKHYLGLPINAPELPTAKTPLECARNELEFYHKLQTEDGHWGGEYGGLMFLLPGLIIAHYITGTPVPESQRLEIIRYLLNRAHVEDGGWGVHIEGVSTVFGTTLTYTCLRVLGFGPDHPAMVKARTTLHTLSGANCIPAWGKFWLSTLEGVNPIPPELWALPDALPISPGNLWVHTRLAYLPMSYIYAHRLSAPLTEFTKSLRDELYTCPYNEINWDKQRNNIAVVDLYMPHSNLMDVINKADTYYKCIPTRWNWLRQYALKLTLEQIKIEDENSFYLDIGPVNKVMNWLVVFYHYGKDSYEFKKHVKRNADYMWMRDEGMMMNGTNGTQLWDATFIAQACVEAKLINIDAYHKSMFKTLDFIDITQPFSTRDQGYTLSYCTAEALKAVIVLQQTPGIPEKINHERLRDAVDILLGIQITDGRFASYECIRGPGYLEAFNPAEVFGNIMTEYSYPECTTAVLTGLSNFRRIDSEYRKDEIIKVSKHALNYIKKIQNKDGSWYGSWAICFTYAGMFTLQSLASVGGYYENSESAKRGCDFLISKQGDGGWGETYKSCETHVYTHNATSQVAVIALLEVKYPEEEPIRRGIELIVKRQKSNGEWLQESIEGVFNKNCMLSYPNYRLAFTIWALGKYANVYGEKVLL
ncbi:terpenoid cyclases/protein prenyltransferase alpha-alpha toroid [Spinellus fusiger]|nr:terpenoid cyclases/protein prenyltransferase alpha-alpha toroid [Spinellus fusiger]